MTNVLPSVAGLESPPQDWVDSITRRPAPHEPREQIDWERRAREAERRALDAEDDAVRARRRIEALLRALESRASIDQAKGVLMGAFGLGADAAFDALVWVSQNANVKLCDIADRVLIDIRSITADRRHGDQLTHLLAAMGAPNGQYFA